VSDADALKQRLKLMLRAERAMGATGVVSIGPSNVIVEPEPVTPTPAGSDRVRMSVDARSDPTRVGVKKDDARDVATEATSSTVPAPPIDMPASLLPIGPDRPPFSEAEHPTPRKVELLRAMDEGEVKGCPKCRLCETRTNTVFGEGAADARLMFIGEGPGENEDLTGRPFIGKAGELLTKMIAGMGLTREQVYIANVVKCRPPNNRVPAPDEVAACTPYLERQIEIIRPRAIVTLGLPSSQYMLQTKTPMGKLRGRWHAWRGIKLMPTYHPAYLLRNYTKETREAVWSDLQMVMKELGLAPRRKNVPGEGG
jgi:uracil-DNA glycosylase family 4